MTTSQSGIYSLVVSSGGCTAQTTLTLPVSVNPAPRAGFRGSSGTVCKGNSTSYEIIFNGLGPWLLNYSINGWAQEPILVGNAASGSPYVFNTTVLPEQTQFYELTGVIDANGCIGFTQGVYTLNVEDCNQAGCVPPGNLRVEPTRAGTATVNWDIVSEQSVCYVLAYGPSAQDPAFWQKILVPHPSSSYTLANLNPGVSYSVEMRTNCNNCSFSSGNFSGATNVSFVMPAARGGELQDGANALLRVYPNPTRGLLFIDIEQPQLAPVYWKVTDITGKVVIEKNPAAVEAGKTTFSLDLSWLSSGLYFLEVNMDNKPYITKISIE
jgi:hypothetical protein